MYETNSNGREIDEMIDNWTKDVRTMLASYPSQLVSDAVPELLAFVSVDCKPAHAPGHAEIDKAEHRLGFELPDDYKHFVSRYGGMPAPALVPAGNRFLNIDEIDLYSSKFSEEFLRWMAGRQEASKTQAEVYGDEQLPESFSREHLKSCAALSTHEGSGIYLLNPRVLEHGRMEAWWLDFHLPGAMRFRTFFDLLQHEIQRSMEEISSALA